MFGFKGRSNLCHTHAADTNVLRKAPAVDIRQLSHQDRGTLASVVIGHMGSYQTEEGLQRMKGYGLQTTRRHQLRGLIVCLKQKKATGAKAGYGCCSSSSDTQSGSRIGAVIRTPNAGPTSTSSSGSWSSSSWISGLHSPSLPGLLSLLRLPTCPSFSSSSQPPPCSTSRPGASFLWAVGAASLTSSCTSSCPCPSGHSAYGKRALPSPSVMIEHQAEPLWMGEVRGRGVRKRWIVGGAERWKSASEGFAKKMKGGKSKLFLSGKSTHHPGLCRILSVICVIRNKGYSFPDMLKDIPM